MATMQTFYSNRETDRQRDRERQTERERDRHRERETETERQRETEREGKRRQSGRDLSTPKNRSPRSVSLAQGEDEALLKCTGSRVPFVTDEEKKAFLKRASFCNQVRTQRFLGHYLLSRALDICITTSNARRGGG